MRQGKFGFYCPTKLEDGSWCKYKGQAENAAPRANSSPTQPPKENRNWDKEAYEKCCSIWAAALLEAGIPVESERGTDQAYVVGIKEWIVRERFWNLFQAIRADGEKRFATGWAKAEQTFKSAPPANMVEDLFNEPPIEAFDPQ